MNILVHEVMWYGQLVSRNPCKQINFTAFFSVFPSFSKTPDDVTVRAGTTARLECAAQGYPAPQIAWQKDGGDDFPAARERRMHIMPNDDVFFIVSVKSSDQGVYSCTATNEAGTKVANASVNVLGKFVNKITFWGSDVFKIRFILT